MRKKTKFLLLRSTIVLLFAILAGRIWYVQVVMGSYYRAQGDTSKIRNEPVRALRGIVYDRFGRQIVWNEPSWNVSIVPHGISDSRAKSIYAQVSQVLHGDPSAAKIASMVWNHRFQPYAAVLIKPNIPEAAAMLIKQKHSELPGVRADLSTVRQYAVDPQFSLSHILGYTSKITGPDYAADRATYPLERFGLNDQIGKDGMELSLDPYLHGVNGTQQVEVDAGERPIRTIRQAVTVPGDNVYLTLNWKLQQRVASDLSAALAKLSLRRGIAVVEDVHSGQILSMVSLPSYNDNWFAGGISFSRYKSLLNAPGKPLNDYAAAGAFPPGSTYKVITAAAALQTHVADVNRYIDDAGVIKLCSVYDPSSCQKFFGWNPAGLGPVNVVGALAKSSDIYFYTVAGGDPNKGTLPYVGYRRLGYYAGLFGIGSPTGIELPNEAHGLVPSPSNCGTSWHIGDTYNMAIGQGCNLASPLQMANIAATIANGGTLYHPRIIQQIVGRLIPRRGVLPRTEVVQPFVPSIARQHFIDPYNLSLIQEGMHHSVDWGLAGGGTSFAVTDKRIDAAGKTGTAETVLGQPPHAWWIGYAPFNHPRIAVCVMVPYAGSEGAYVAAPIAHKIFEDYFHLPSNKPNWLDDVKQQLVAGGGGAQ